MKRIFWGPSGVIDGDIVVALCTITFRYVLKYHSGDTNGVRFAVRAAAGACLQH